jgi:pimeloyl-ACP methyl ester carboxylesterase
MSMIYILPGIGADNSMYQDEWRTLEDSRFLDWPGYQGETSLTAIARRLVEEQDIRDGSVVVGHSLGGMVSCEIAQLRTLKALILIGSASCKEGVSNLLAMLHPLAPYTPFEFMQAVARMLPGEVTAMFGRSDPEFIRAACKAIFKWKGLPPAGIRPRRIHGRFDVVIPPPAQVDCALNGGHMIPVTHARDCVAFVRAAL